MRGILPARSPNSLPSSSRTSPTSKSVGSPPIRSIRSPEPSSRYLSQFAHTAYESSAPPSASPFPWEPVDTMLTWYQLYIAAKTLLPPTHASRPTHHSVLTSPIALSEQLASCLQDKIPIYVKSKNRKHDESTPGKPRNRHERSDGIAREYVVGECRQRDEKNCQTPHNGWQHESLPDNTSTTPFWSTSAPVKHANGSAIRGFGSRSSTLMTTAT
jgi:hypothetical protein